MNNLVTMDKENISNKIHTIHGLIVMLDRDLAELYGVETRALKQAVKRNIDRFPNDFMFELTDEEMNFLVSQSVIPSKKSFGGARPFVFTEQGVSSLSAVLSSKIAVEIHIKIIRAFVEMRKIISSNSLLFSKMEALEKRQISYEIKTDTKIDYVLNALEEKTQKLDEGVFFDGQIYDAYAFINDLFRSAKNEVVLIDNYIDDTVFTLFSKYPALKIKIYTQTISKHLKLDYQKYQAQYQNIELQEFKNAHDRFMILDNKEVYHIGASLKDLGKKWFAFSKFDMGALEILKKLEKQI
ncbi:MAG: ORF6N domain-containing protein [Sulfurimonas sp.]|uniref:ORF6N domain-containing protein n=1 Tax=Sulfurimonas sp. TaxID=2022749 RepID=UPI0026152FAE|nr:ORF6N domain-containing protein [Sulfurimonas sp.]MDD5372297.1 ORF6N domain-containing protein [Sulfurimonas sp.]